MFPIFLVIISGKISSYSGGCVYSVVVPNKQNWVLIREGGVFGMNNTVSKFYSNVREWVSIFVINIFCQLNLS